MIVGGGGGDLVKAALTTFAVAAAAHLASLAAGITWLEWASKAVLIPALAVWVLAARGPRLIVAALGLSAAGDITLQFDSLFIVGMGFFAAAHVCYVTYFVRAGALRRRWPITVLYVATWAALIVLLWPGLGALRIPVALYALLLTGTAATSAGFGLRTGLGGLLFFVSDGLISLRLADLPQPPLADLWIMSTYIAAQYLLASGVLRAQRATSPTPQAAPAVV